jgi:DMSO reductase anchor subunit
MPRFHWQLVLFTILTQLAVGGIVLWGLSTILLPSTQFLVTAPFTNVFLLVVFLTMVAAAFVASCHLGHPLRAVYVLINYKNSWLSREAYLGGLFSLLVFVLLIMRLKNPKFGILDQGIISIIFLIGMTLVYSISRLYMLRTVPTWNHIGTPATFFVTCFILGLIMNMLYWTLFPALRIGLPVVMLLVVLVLFQLVFTSIVSFSLVSRGGKAAESIRLIWNELRWIFLMRWFTACLGLVILLSNWIFKYQTYWIVISLMMVFISEILGRFIFYGQYRRIGY